MSESNRNSALWNMQCIPCYLQSSHFNESTNKAFTFIELIYMSVGAVCPFAHSDHVRKSPVNFISRCESNRKQCTLKQQTRYVFHVTWETSLSPSSLFNESMNWAFTFCPCAHSDDVIPFMLCGRPPYLPVPCWMKVWTELYTSV